MKEVTYEDWESEVILSDQTVLVYFWATWCQPCKMQGLVLTQLQEALPGLKIVKVNADEEEALIEAHNVTSIPTLILYKEGETAWELTGAKPLQVLKDKVLPYV